MVGPGLAVDTRHVQRRERKVHEEGKERVPDVHDEGYALRQEKKKADHGYGDIEVGQTELVVSY